MSRIHIVICQKYPFSILCGTTSLTNPKSSNKLNVIEIWQIQAWVTDNSTPSSIKLVERLGVFFPLSQKCAWWEQNKYWYINVGFKNDSILSESEHKAKQFENHRTDLSIGAFVVQLGSTHIIHYTASCATHMLQSQLTCEWITTLLNLFRSGNAVAGSAKSTGLWQLALLSAPLSALQRHRSRADQ